MTLDLHLRLRAGASCVVATVLVIDEISRRLASERARVAVRIRELEREHAAIVAASDTANLDDEHDPEGATVGFERAQVEALLRRARIHAAELDEAVRRVEAGAYGTCRSCGAPIDPERLEARPAAETCVGCAR